MSLKKRPVSSPISPSASSKRARVAIVGDSMDIDLPERVHYIEEVLMDVDQDSADQEAANTTASPQDIHQITAKLSRDFDSQRIERALTKLYYAPEAAYDIQGRNGCMENTRVDILKELISWSKDATAPTIFWLSGMAGTGKTSIAHSLCEKLVANQSFGGSFFCRRSAGYSEATRIIPCLAYLLARKIEPFRLLLAEYLERSDGVAYKAISVQIDILLRDPLSKLLRDSIPPLVLVVDALDECSDKDATADMLNALISSAPNIPIKIFVTSRPELHIRDTQLADGALSCIIKLHEIDESAVNSDIRLYLQSHLEKFFSRKRIPMFTQGDINVLVRLSGQLFIFASTAVKYICDRNSAERLRTLTGLSPATHGPNLSTRSLDFMYKIIIRDSLSVEDMESGELERLKAILASILASRSSLSVETLGELLNMSLTTLRDSLDRLHAVIRVPDVDSASGLSTLHASFEDFLTSTNRAPRELLIDLSAGHTVLAQGCLNVMELRLRFNMCKLSSSYVFDSHVEGLQQRVEENILCTPGLEYACRYWTSHLIRATTASEYAECLCKKLLKLGQEKIIFWIEVMSLLGANTDCYNGITAAQSWVAQVPDCVADLQTTLSAVARLSSSFWMAAPSLSTPHLYISSLATEFAINPHIPSGWGKIFPGVPQVRCNQAKHSGPVLVKYINTHSFISHVAFSPDGKRVASGSHDKTVRIWDAETGQTIVGPFEGHEDAVLSVAFFPDGTRIASGSRDSTARIWDMETGQTIAGPFEGHESAVWSVAFSPDGKCVASGSADKTIRIWDAEMGQTVAGPFKGHERPVLSVAFSPDGKRVASSSEDSTIRIWDAATGQTTASPFEGHEYSVSSVAFSPDGKRIASGSDDKTIRIWDAETGQTIAGPFQGHKYSVSSVAFSPDGKRIASGSDDKTIQIWDAETGQTIAGPFEGHEDLISSVAFSPDGKRVASGSLDLTIRIWDAETGQTMASSFEGHKDTVWSVAFSPDGKRVASGSFDSTIRIWDAETGQTMAGPFEGHKGWVRSVAFSPDGERVASGSHDSTIRIWDVETGQTMASPFKGHECPVLSVAFSPDGKRVASSSDDSTIRIWDAKTGQTTAGPFEGHKSSVSSVAFSPDGKRVASGSYDRTIRIWDAGTGQTMAGPFEGHEGEILSVAFSPDGKRVASGSYDKTIRIWDAETGQVMAGPFQDHESPVYSVAFSPDGKRVASGSLESTIRIWDAETGQTMAGPFEDSVSSVTFSPDGKRVASSSHDSTIRIWDAETGQTMSGSFEGHESSILSVAFFPDKERTASSSDDKTIRKFNSLSNILSTFPIEHLAQAVAAPAGKSRASFTNRFKIDEDGWIHGKNGELLFWVPPLYRANLYQPGNTLVIGPYAMRVDFTNDLHGEDWTKCYKGTD